ncbi:MAG: phosphonate ABC transporter, permease protein PhnE [Candidatus Cloacimonetes bacterium]|nr:phosphonate ABC transporter, permease protein PhnE [Candidatus Cloacimonadota bacterium]MBS3766767.1 phosphonate ABC transporter, permease protein PhnE [Candidatus Cloacimonadota bacterium]
MKKQYNTLSLIKAFIIDLLIWLYLVGTGFYLLEQLNVVEYKFSYFLITSVVLGIITFVTQNSLGHKGFRSKKIKKRRWYKTLWGWEIFILIAITFVVGWDIVEVNPIKLIAKFKNSKVIISQLFNPNFDNLLKMLSALSETIYLALLATVFAIPLAFIFSFFAARNLMPKNLLGNTVYIIVRTVATIVRSIEALVWAIIFCVWVGIGPFAGMLALLFHSMAALTKLYSEQIENIDSGPIEAMKSTGANTLQVWIYAVIPQIISPYLAFTMYRWDINVRMATIVGFVGGGGIGLALKQEQQLLHWRNVGLIMWLIALVVWIMDMVSGKVREKLVKH